MLYQVLRKSDGLKVYEYNADSAIEWVGFEFSSHDHIAVDVPSIPETFVPKEWFINVGSFYDRFGAYKIPILASADPLVQAIIKDTTVRKYIDLKGRYSELVQALELIRSKGYPVTTSDVLDVAPTSDEVYRG